MPDKMKVYKCPSCNVLWVEDQILIGQDRNHHDVYLCPQDHTRVEDITDTQRGRNFAILYQSWEAEEQKRSKQ